MSSEPYITPYTVVIDTREQAPFYFQGMKADAKHGGGPMIVRTIVDGLKTGDYSLEGYEDRVAVERKSLQDAYQTFSHGRDRFERELERLAAMECAAVVIEECWPRIMSRTCPTCGGVGYFLAESEDALEIKLSRKELYAKLELRLCDVVHELMVSVKPLEEVLSEINPQRTICADCQGTGNIHPLDHSQFTPKSFIRSVIAWQNRYPNVQWWACETRRFAEQITLRKLERFWLDEQERLKKGSK